MAALPPSMAAILAATLSLVGFCRREKKSPFSFTWKNLALAGLEAYLTV